MDDILSNVRPASQTAKKYLMATIAGEQGIGKTTFATEWPKPLIVAVENGLRSIAHKDTPAIVIEHSHDLREIVEKFLPMRGNDMEYQTLIIDSVTALETMITEEMLKLDGSSSLAHLGGGYGAGYKMLEHKFANIMDAMTALQVKMHIVFILQSEVITYTPEDADPYDRLTVRLDKRLHKFVLDRPDVVAFLRERKSVKKTSGQSHIASGTGEVELVAHKNPAITSKNRIGIKKAILLPEGVNPILDAKSRKSATAQSPNEY